MSELRPTEPVVLDQNERVDCIMEYEGGELGTEDVLKFFSDLIRSGLAWSFQGSYGRQAQRFMGANLIGGDGTINWAKYDELLDTE